MPRTLTVRNPRHPRNMAHAVGQKAKAEARQLSNKDLDEYLSSYIKKPENLAEILKWPRHKKIKFIHQSAMAWFAEGYDKAGPPTLGGAE